MKYVEFYLLDCYPDSLELLKYYLSRYKTDKKIIVNVLPPLYADGTTLSVFGSRFLNHTTVRECRTPLVMLNRMKEYSRNYIAIHKVPVTNPEILDRCIWVDETASKIVQTEMELVKSIACIDFKLADRAIEKLAVGVGLEKGFPTMEIPVTRIDSGMQDARVVLIFAASLGDSATGTGMGNHRMSVIEHLSNQARDRGYNLSVYHEDDISQIRLSSNDIVHGICVNGLYAGSYTTHSFGFKLHNLLRLADMSKGLARKPIISGSIHAAECRLLGKIDRATALRLSTMKYSSYTDNGIQYLLELGLPVTKGRTPIAATYPGKIQPPRVHSNNQFKMFLQVDTQFRKNGEYALLCCIDAFALAKKTNPQLTGEIVCKSSAAYSYHDEAMLRKVVTSSGVSYPNPVPGLKLSFQGFGGLDKWIGTVGSSDIGVFFSVEEGIHLIVGEAWMYGVNCILSSTPSYTGYKDLKEGVTLVPVRTVPYAGCGKHNDMMDTNAMFFDYNSGMKIVAEAMLSSRNCGYRDGKDQSVYDYDGHLLAEFLNMNSIEVPSTDFKMEFSRKGLLEGLRVNK